MHRNQRKLVLSSLLCGLPLYAGVGYAAIPIDLNHQPVSMLQSFIQDTNAIKVINRSVDFNKTLHIRIQQTYLGYPVWGADAVIHIPHAKNDSLKLLLSTANRGAFMNGTVYQNLQKDLEKTPAIVFTKAQAQKTLQSAIENYQHKIGNSIDAKDQKSDLIVYVDEANQAHFAYKVSFFVQPARSDVTPARPIYIMDAMTSRVYQQWDDIKTAGVVSDDVIGGGFGGNPKMGKLMYDGLSDHLASLGMQRDGTTCELQNKDVIVERYGSNKVMSFTCKAQDPDHNNVYWNASFDTVNQGYSPANDALSAGIVIKHMYQDWYGVPVLTNPDGSPMLLRMVVHVANYENAYWDGEKMTFGDGRNTFYPLTSLGVGAHEISHGFTEQHSDLIYSRQSGGMNEAFSDMAAQAAEFYSYGKNSWQIGPEIFKKANEALRYMDKPSKDCRGGQPGNWCSIDDATQYRDGIDVHFSSGVYNRFFYTLGTTNGWDARKAFDVMVQANSHYWTRSTNFSQGACGVISAAKDLGFSTDDVKKAFDVVKVNYQKC